MREIFAKSRMLMLVTALVTAGLLFAEVALAEDSAEAKIFVVIGTATVQGANVSVAREKAITDGLVTAVALMAEEILQMETFVGQFQQLNDLLFNQPTAFIQDYRVLTEAAGAQSYRVVVEATVSRRKISQQLTEAGILRVQKALPAVLFLIAEQHIGDPFPNFWWGPEGEDFVSLAETAMAEHLIAAGFTIIDHRGVRSRPLVDWAAYGRPDLTNQEAAQLGSLLKADVVVMGMSVVTPSTNIMGSAMRSFNGAINARVIRVDSAQPMLNFTRTAVAVNENDIDGSRQALEAVGGLAGQTLAAELTAAWQEQAGKPAVVTMVIRGTGHLANYVKFRKTLNTISGVEGIRVSEIKPNEATLLVEYKGKTKDLAAALMQQNFESFGINIFEVTSDTVRIDLIPG
jgi:hypothetical protein